MCGPARWSARKTTRTRKEECSQIQRRKAIHTSKWTIPIFFLEVSCPMLLDALLENRYELSDCLSGTNWDESSKQVVYGTSNNYYFSSSFQAQSDDKSKNDSIKIVSRSHLPPAPVKGASRAAKMRAVARGDDTASNLKQEQQVRCHRILRYLSLITCPCTGR